MEGGNLMRKTGKGVDWRRKKKTKMKKNKSVKGLKRTMARLRNHVSCNFNTQNNQKHGNK